MSFEIPNETDATDPTQAELDRRDLEAITTAIERDLVLVDGFEVTENSGGADMSVDVADGVVSTSGILIPITGGNEAIAAADPDDPRFDLVIIDSGISIVTGTPAPAPAFPAVVPSDSVLLAAVFVPAADTTISDDQIVDKRFLSSDATPFPALLTLDPFGTPNTAWGIDPGTPYTDPTRQNITPIVDDIYFEPFVVPRRMSLDALAIQVETGTGTGGDEARLGIYRAEGVLSGHNPFGLILDAGTVPINAAGFQTLTGLAQELPPGNYWKAIVYESVAGPLSITRWEGGPMWIVDDGADVNRYVINVRNAAATFGALPSTAAADTWGTAGAEGFRHSILVQWSQL